MIRNFEFMGCAWSLELYTFLYNWRIHHVTDSTWRSAVSGARGKKSSVRFHHVHTHVQSYIGLHIPSGTNYCFFVLFFVFTSELLSDLWPICKWLVYYLFIFFFISGRFQRPCPKVAPGARTPLPPPLIMPLVTEGEVNWKRGFVYL